MPGFVNVKKGTSLIEVMVAVVICAIVMLGGSSLFVHGRSQIDLQKNARVAVQLAAQKLEELKAGSYNDIEEGQTEECISLEDSSFTRTVDTEDTGKYKKVRVAVSWKQASKDHAVGLATIIAPE